MEKNNTRIDLFQRKKRNGDLYRTQGPPKGVNVSGLDGLEEGAEVRGDVGFEIKLG